MYLMMYLIDFRESPTARDQALFAKAIIHVVPSWRRNGSDSKFGTVRETNFTWICNLFQTLNTFSLLFAGYFIR